MKKQRILIVLLLIVVIPIGFYSKFYSGPAQEWVSHSMGGLVYEIFWCLLIALFLPKVKPYQVALLVFVSTSILEFLQLWKPAFLEMLRSTFLGRTVLGNSFNPMDFPYYAIGCLLGWGLLFLIKKITLTKEHT